MNEWERVDVWNDEYSPATNVLHKVNVQERSLPFVVDGKTEYTLVVGEGEENEKAADFIQEQVYLATGATLKKVESKNCSIWTEKDCYIVIGVPHLFEEANLQMPKEELVRSGYYIKTVGKSVFLSVVYPEGMQHAAIAFLRHALGYVMYAEDTVVYEKDGKTLPNMDIVEKPDFDHTPSSNRLSEKVDYAMGFRNTDWIPVNGRTIHNSFAYLPPQEYYEKHPKWYSTSVDEKTGLPKELCYTAQGDEAERQAMIEEIANKIKYWVDEYPNKKAITFTIQDTMQFCGCSACKAYREKYNDSNAAAIVQVLNAVNRLVKPHLQKRNRELDILFFAYNRTEKPPVKRNGEGKWTPVDESVVCDENVIPYLAVAACYFSYPFEHPKNQSIYEKGRNQRAKDSVEGWSACAKKLYMWLYETNFEHYLYPFNSWDSMGATYRFCKKNNAVYMYSEGQFNNDVVVAFSRFKDYINSRSMFDVNESYRQIKHDFFKHYFKDAETPMLKYFDDLVTEMRRLEVFYPGVIGGWMYDTVNTNRLWEREKLDAWLAFCEQAYQAIAHYEKEAPALYATLKRHIDLETIFPKYAILECYSHTFTLSEIKARRLAFYKDCQALGITRLKEGATFEKEKIFETWEVLENE